MKLVFSSDCIKFPLTGIGRYALELTNYLQTSDEISSLRYLNGRQLIDQRPVPVESGAVESKLRSVLKKNPLITEAYRYTYPWLKSRALKQAPDAIFHCPNYYLPPNVGNAITTFHDLSIFTWPECHPPERVKYMRKELLLSLKRAERLLTVSEFSRQEIASYFNYPLDKIDATPLASSGQFYVRKPEETAELMRNLGLEHGKYCLYTGTIEPRKNIATLLDAYERLPLSIRNHYPLVLCGYSGWSSEAIHLRFQRGEREGWIKYLGYVASKELPLLFAAANTFLFPSLYEGFGLPVLESMASGVPVVCSNAASLPEVVGDAALVCEPLDVEALTAAIQRCIEDNQWRQLSIETGLKQAKKFSWARCAEETIAAYKKV
ncbi:glycosyltransferase [Rouxiella sp. S1S-2]|uniref:glycosyltransferase family 4 protein n=1 Tax=Rouxiella sp. S1S-2 TaxID=2653856 RepID=UPI001265922F|nr:glycosyltransferase family 1 protein [Rouxiella sp. S1S-2]KAB7897080.1 glycosyltransferase [Rouxiella sp. S1S-2]